MNPRFLDRSRDPPSSSASCASAERILSDLRDRVCRKIPRWSERGPEDAGWVLLEVFAEALAELEGEVEGLEERLYPRLLESLGEEPRWALSSRGAVVFVPGEGVDEPVPIPAGTVVGAQRKDGDARLSFETAASAWASSARLMRVVTCAGQEQEELFPYPQSGWDGESVPLFSGRVGIVRQLYLGDEAFLYLRDGGALELEWPGNPQVLGEGQWEYSVRGGWRALRVDLEMNEGAARGKRRVRMRLAGALPDFSAETIETACLPWLRVSLPGGRRTSLGQPRWVSATGGPAAAAPGSGGEAGALTFPRAVSRIFSYGGERWEDHSLSTQKIFPVDSSESWDPAVYLGWERPVPASVYWSLVSHVTPPGWGGVDGRRSPELAWEHSSGRAFRELDVTDQTAGFTRSGCVSWDLPQDWSVQEHFGERLYWVRARWVRGAYPKPPRVGAILPHAAEVHGRRTFVDQLLEAMIDRRGRGVLIFPGGEPERFGALDVSRDGGEWRRLVSQQAQRSVTGRFPDGKPEPVSAGPQEAGLQEGSFRVARLPQGNYALDVGPGPEVTGPGNLTVRIPSLRIGSGARGNVGAGTLQVLEAEVPGIGKTLQPLPTGGGLDPETAEAFRERIRADWMTGERAVSTLDFRRLTRALDTEIARVEVVSNPANAAHLVVTVVPHDPCSPGRIHPERLAWLGESLGAKTPLGTVVEVVEPVYLPIEIAVRRLDDPAEDDAAAHWEGPRRSAEERIKRLLHPVRGGTDGRGFPSTTGLRLEELASIVRPALEDTLVHRFEFDILAPGGKPLWDIKDGERTLTATLVVPVLERLYFES